MAEAEGAPAPQAAPSIARGAAAVTVGILASRLVGLVRQRVLAHYLGTTEAADAVAAAFRVGNITQNLLGEGTLSASFIPVYARLRASEGAAAAARFARAALGLLLASVVVISVLGVVFAPTLAAIIAAGFEGHRLALTTELVRIVFPMTGLLVISAWALGVLNAHRRFLLSYAAPVVWSLAQIAALLVAGMALGASHDGLAESVAWGALVGAGLQLAVMLPAVHTAMGTFAPTIDKAAPGLSRAIGRLPAAVLGRGVIQLSGLVDTLLVSFLGPGAIATFAYAQTIYLLPMSVLGTGEAAAALPEMSEAATDKDRRATLVSSVGRSLARVVALAVAAAAVFAVFGREVVTLLLRGGTFDLASSEAVTTVLAAYAAGLPGNAASRVLASACFAVGDTSRPARFAVVRVVVSTGVSLLLMRQLGVSGVVLGAATAAWVELALLGHAARGHLGGLGLSAIPFGRIAVAVGLAIGGGLAARAGLDAVRLESVWIASAIVLALVGGVLLVAFDRLGVMSFRALLRRSAN